jgi:hypothetical protein
MGNSNNRSSRNHTNSTNNYNTDTSIWWISTEFPKTSKRLKSEGNNGMSEKGLKGWTRETTKKKKKKKKKGREERVLSREIIRATKSCGMISRWRSRMVWTRRTSFCKSLSFGWREGIWQREREDEREKLQHSIVHTRRAGCVKVYYDLLEGMKRINTTLLASLI